MDGCIQNWSICWFYEFPIICTKGISVLTHLFPMHPFSTPWKHKKTVKVSCFQGVEKGCIGNESVNNSTVLFVQNSVINKFQAISSIFLPQWSNAKFEQILQGKGWYFNPFPCFSIYIYIKTHTHTDGIFIKRSLRWLIFARQCLQRTYFPNMIQLDLYCHIKKAPNYWHFLITNQRTQQLIFIYIWNTH